MSIGHCQGLAGHVYLCFSCCVGQRVPCLGFWSGVSGGTGPAASGGKGLLTTLAALLSDQLAFP